MRAGWEGNDRLQDYVRRVDSGAELIAEVISVEGYDTKRTATDWSDGVATGGSVTNLNDGGVRLAASETTLVSHGPDDGTQVTNLGAAPPFDCIIVEHLGANAEDREFHTLTARLDPRADGGDPKTVDHFIAEAFRVTKRDGPDLIHVELIARSAKVDATGEVEADFDFTLVPVSGRYPVAGPPPEFDRDATPAQRPQTLLRIVPYQADGTLADNVAWMSDSAAGSSITDSSTYQVTHYSIIASTNQERLETGGSVWELQGVVNDMPEFELTRSSYTAATVTFALTGNDIDDIAGSGDLRIVARGEEWGDSALTWEIWDGTSAWVECVDGDVLGADNRTTIDGVTYGSDLSSIPTTGPWDIQVTLTPSTSSLRSPVAVEFGIERVSTTSLAGVATILEGGDQSISDLTTLVAQIPAATLSIPRTGEKDFRDYGIELITANHIGDIEVRLYIGDPNDGKADQYLHRSEWVLHSVWDLEDYGMTDSEVILDLLSPVRLLRIPIPPFQVTSGNDGTREAVTVSGTRKAAYEELLDSLAALPGRYRGPGVEDTSNSVNKTIVESDLLDELNAVAFLGGQAVIESQGRIKAVTVMRDEPVDYVVARYPLGSYEPRGRFGPGFRTRLDEFFVRYNWEDSDQRFDNEIRVVNATAFDKLGGAGLLAETRLDEEICKWITTETLADDVGRRHPKHFGNGQVVWSIQAKDGYRNPALEIGDVAVVETELFAARSPINSQEIRGPVVGVGIVVGTDLWGQNVDVWIPGFEYIVAGTGDVALEVGPIPTVQVIDQMYSVGVSSGNQGWKRLLNLICGPGTKSVNIAISDYIETLGIDDGGWPSQLVSGWNYNVDVTPSSTEAHVFQASGGASDAVIVSRYDEGNLLPGGRTGTITVTPYSEAAGGGVAGKAVTITAKDPDDYDFVGFRTLETMDRRVDNNDTPGLGGFDLDMDNTANGFAFSWTNGEGESVDLSRIRFYLKATGSPSGQVVVRIYSDSGGLPGTALGTAPTIAPSILTGSYVAYDFDFSTVVSVADGVTIHGSVEYLSGDASNYVSVEADDAGSCSELNGSWAAGPSTREPLWRLYVEDEVERFARRAVPAGNLSAAVNSSTGELELTA